ncbi:MAG: uracil-DNA glycosylase [Deltaproteobacteria bacterium]|nr:uracil-DNA glycosylase [Deltaproteobacteria bacterium]
MRRPARNGLKVVAPRIGSFSGFKRRLVSACAKTTEFKGLEPVLGDGPCPCDVMIIGEAPGREETKVKKPFVGRAGRFFTAVLEDTLRRKREDIYITNAVKIWPRIETKRGKTRPPTRAEEEFFLPYLYEEVSAVNPLVIVAVGKTALRAVMPRGRFIPGEWIPAGPAGWPSRTAGWDEGRRGRLSGRFSVMPVYHPAYILRRQKDMKAMTGGLKKALRKVKRRLGSFQPAVLDGPKAF